MESALCTFGRERRAPGQPCQERVRVEIFADASFQTRSEIRTVSVAVGPHRSSRETPLLETGLRCVSALVQHAGFESCIVAPRKGARQRAQGPDVDWIDFHDSPQEPHAFLVGRSQSAESEQGVHDRRFLVGQGLIERPGTGAVGVLGRSAASQLGELEVAFGFEQASFRVCGLDLRTQRPLEPVGAAFLRGTALGARELEGALPASVIETRACFLRAERRARYARE